MENLTFRTFAISDPRFERDGLRHVTVKSAALRGRGDLTIFVPEGVAAQSGAPLVILLHGVYGSHWSWAYHGGAHRTTARLIAAGEIPPMILAMPSDGLAGDGTGYVPHAAADFERWILAEVPLAAAHAAPAVTARSPVFIAGLSMGGFGALRLMAKYPGRFRGASGHSSITEFGQLRTFVAEDIAKFAPPAEEQRVIDLILRQRDSVPAFRFDCGVDDPLLGANRTLHDALTRAGVQHDYREAPGGHEWSYWERHCADSLRFFGELARAS